MNGRRQEIMKQLKTKSLDCLICLLPVVKKVQSCQKCFQLYHFDCLKKWTTTKKTCPNCVEFIEPIDSCFCGKSSDLSCGQTCSVKLECKHKCLLTCHPGPHDCMFSGKKMCYCRKYSVVEKCSVIDDVHLNTDGQKVLLTRQQDGSLKCDQVCGKVMDCGHICNNICCLKCQCIVMQKCYCGKTTKSTNCGQQFSCKNICGYIYNCGHGNDY